MCSKIKLMVFVGVVAVIFQTAIADEATDAVRVLSKLWKGTHYHDQGSYVEDQFVGDDKTYKMYRISQR